MTDHPVKILFTEMKRAIPQPYPNGVVRVPEQIQGTSFFPGGTGLWVEEPGVLPPLPVGGVMVLGHDFHSEAGYRKSLDAGAESASLPTWSGLLDLLERIPIPLAQCFFTNVYMGLREDRKTTGPFPGAKSKDFVSRCQDFFLHQIALQLPSLILSLGTNVPPFLAPLSQELGGWAGSGGFKKWDSAHTALISGVSFGVPRHRPCTIVLLTHPSFRRLNVGRRVWGRLAGDAAEVALVREAITRIDPPRRAVVEAPPPNRHDV